MEQLIAFFNENESDKLTKLNFMTNESQNSDFILNLDSQTVLKPNFIKIRDQKKSIFVFAIFASAPFVNELMLLYPNMKVYVVFPLDVIGHFGFLNAFLGLKEAELENLEGFMATEFSQLAANLR